MSKNKGVDELVEEVLPLIAIYVRYVGDKVYVDDVQEHEKSLMNQATCNARTALKSAIEQGKLVKPLSEEAIRTILENNWRENDARKAMLIHQAQFERK